MGKRLQTYTSPLFRPILVPYFRGEPGFFMVSEERYFDFVHHKITCSAIKNLSTQNILAFFKISYVFDKHNIVYYMKSYYTPASEV